MVYHVWATGGQRALSDPRTNIPNVSLEDHFKICTFNVILDSVIASITHRFKAITEIYDNLCFSWNYTNIDNEELLKASAKKFHEVYNCDVSIELIDEIILLKSIHSSNIGEPLAPLALLNKLNELKLNNLFPNICIVLRIFLTLPVTVASAERSFSVLARIKNHCRATMGQKRLNGLAILAIESKMARTINYVDIIEDFAQQKARKANF